MQQLLPPKHKLRDHSFLNDGRRGNALPVLLFAFDRAQLK
jgi:hypothetical protein